MCSLSLLKDRVRLLFSSFPCKLLIILDDVVDANDVIEYVEVFNVCKTLLTTRKNDINITIPSKHCFDIGPMKPFEAVQLLTWQIPQLAALSVNNANKIQELAKDLHYWPLLLSLVRGQLHIHCKGWNEPPTSAILNVRQKLQDKGLTAFDPQHIKKENAVKASINASLELLSSGEKDILFHIVTSIGIGSYVLKACIFKLSKVDSEEFDKLIENIWSHGLINIGSRKLPFYTKVFSYIEIHDVIAQYIIEDMPYDYHLFLNKIRIDDSFNCFFSVYMEIDYATDFQTSFFVDIIDVFVIPFIIRAFAVYTRARQVEFSEALDYLIECHSEILETNSLTKFLNAKQPLSQIYGFVKENCRIIQSMLASKRYDEAATWISEYTDNHPFSVLMKSIQTLNDELTNECKHNPMVVQLINKTVGTIYLNADTNNIGKLFSPIVNGRKIISEMIEVGASDTEISEVLAMALSLGKCV